MARDSSGNHTLPAGNPVVNATTIDPAWGNDTMNDLSTEITASLDRSGRGGMLAGLKSFAGTVSLPGVAFSDETSSGLYRQAAGVVRFSLLGSDLAEFSANSFKMFASGVIYTDTIAEVTGAAGVTIDGVVLKDGGVDGVVGGVTPAAGTFTSFTSNGIDDNATKEMMQVTDTGIALGDASAAEALYLFLNTTTDGLMRISGGSGPAVGANLSIFGESHATNASDFLFRNSAVDVLQYDASLTTWNFQANDITTTGDLTCAAFTSTGIDDNASGEMLQLTDNIFSLGLQGAGEQFVMHKGAIDDGILKISGGSGATTGANLWLFGSSHASANNIVFRGSSTIQLQYTESSSIWDFQDNTIAIGTKTPASATAAGTAGEIAYDADYLYICLASGTWRRIAHDTW